MIHQKEVNLYQAGETFRVDLKLTTTVDLFKASARVASNSPKVIIKDVEFPEYAGNVLKFKKDISATGTEYIMGVETQFTLLFAAGFDDVIATVVFEVADDTGS